LCCVLILLCCELMFAFKFCCVVHCWATVETTCRHKGSQFTTKTQTQSHFLVQKH